MEEFKDKIKRLRIELDLTLEQVGKIVGVTKATVQRWESGNIANLRRDKIAKLAKALHVSPAYLMGWEKDTGNIESDAPITQVPILGRIAAGVPMLANENIEGYAFAPVPDPENYFYLRVKGDSMINARIHDGDLVLVHIQPCAENGQIVVCLIDGEDATLKRYREKGGMIILQPENSTYEPIILSQKDFENGYVVIQGIVKSVQFNL